MNNIKYKKINDEVFYTNSSITRISKLEIDKLNAEAKLKKELMKLNFLLHLQKTQSFLHSFRGNLELLFEYTHS